MSKQIVAKFYAATVKPTPHGEEIVLQAVTSDTPENKQWSEFTPSGTLQMCISNPAAQGLFAEGKFYLLTVCSAEPEAAADAEPAPPRGGNVPNAS